MAAADSRCEHGERKKGTGKTHSSGLRGGRQLSPIEHITEMRQIQTYTLLWLHVLLTAACANMSSFVLCVKICQNMLLYSDKMEKENTGKPGASS